MSSDLQSPSCVLGWWTCPSDSRDGETHRGTLPGSPISRSEQVGGTHCLSCLFTAPNICMTNCSNSTFPHGIGLMVLGVPLLTPIV